MAALHALALIVAAPAPSAAPASTGLPLAAVKATVPVQASVRILPGAKVNLSTKAEMDGYQLHPVTITVEDGSRRPAKLIEFE